MRREEVLEEFGIPISEWGNCESIADEILRLRNVVLVERELIKQLRQRVAVVQAERESVSSQLWDCMNERDALKERLAAIEIGRSIETFTADEHTLASMLESLLDGMIREINRHALDDEVAFYVKDFAATLRAAFPQIDGESTLLANYFGMCEERNEYRDKLAHMTAADHIAALEAMGAVCDSVKMLVGDNGSVSIGAHVLILPPEMRDAR